MNTEKQRWIGLAGVVLIYCILAYIFMWWPVVRPYTASTNACINNLRQVDAAINQWALEKGKHSGDPVSLADLTPYIKLNSRGEIPECPAGGKYGVTVVGAPPICSLSTNLLAPKKVRVDYFYWKIDQGYESHILP